MKGTKRFVSPTHNQEQFVKGTKRFVSPTHSPPGEMGKSRIATRRLAVIVGSQIMF